MITWNHERCHFIYVHLVLEKLLKHSLVEYCIYQIFIKIKRITVAVYNKSVYVHWFISLEANQENNWIHQEVQSTGENG